MKFLLSLFLLLSLTAFPSTVSAVTIFESGGTTDFTGTDATGAIVRNSSGGAPTTVHLLAGADLGPTDVEDSSRLNALDGSTVDDFDVLGFARLEISGGSHGGVDYLDSSTGLISGATFTGCFPCLRLFSQAVAVVTGGSFSSPNQIVASTAGFATLEIRDGAFTGIVRAADDSRIAISGGSIERVQSLDQATLILYGDGFLATEGATTVLSGFGEITDSFNGTITGQLSDGSALSVDALNGVVGSKIVLASGATSVPALSLLARFGLVLGVSVAAVLLGPIRARRGKGAAPADF
jgi:hypothetical protein